MNGFLKRDQLRGGSLLRLLMALVVAGFLVVGMTGCDDETTASKVEDARIAIDNGNYDQAIALLLNEANSQDVLDIRSSAYAGQVGIDTFAILAEVDNGDAGGDGSIDLIGKVIGTGSGNTIACSDFASKRTTLQNAITAATAAAGFSTATLDDKENAKAKLGIYGMTDFVLVIGQILCDNYGSVVVPPNTVILTDAWIKSIGSLAGVNFNTLTATIEQKTAINQDIILVQAAITVLGVSNDLAEEFSAFLSKIGGNDGDVTDADLRTFFNGL